METKLIRFVKETFELDTGKKVTIEAYEYEVIGRDYATLGIEGLGRMEMTRRDLVQLTNILNRVTERIDW